MTHQDASDRNGGPAMSGTVTEHHSNPGLLRQLGNGISGLVVLLLTGLVLMVVVLWTSR